MSERTDFRAEDPPKTNQNVYISFLRKSFNEVVCIDHFHLDDVCPINCIVIVSRFSTVHVVESSS